MHGHAHKYASIFWWASHRIAYLCTFRALISLRCFFFSLFFFARFTWIMMEQPKQYTTITARPLCTWIFAHLSWVRVCLCFMLCRAVHIYLTINHACHPNNMATTMVKSNYRLHFAIHPSSTAQHCNHYGISYRILCVAVWKFFEEISQHDQFT